MKLIFKTNDKKVVEFDLDVKNRKIENIKIHDNQERMASGYFHPKADKQTYANLEKILEYYLDAEDLNLNMEDYVKYIEENDFYTPYAENLRAEVQNY